MSDFFGFNTTMPGGRQGGRPAMNLEEQQELDRQVQKYALETGEDFEIYDYGETYDNLADDLEETRDDLNDETFGGIQADEGNHRAIEEEKVMQCMDMETMMNTGGGTGCCTHYADCVRVLINGSLCR